MNARLIVLLITWLLTLPWNAVSQLKFKEMVPLLSSYSSEQQKNLLKEYLLTDLDHANANFRLALIYEKKYKEADPLAEYAYATANAEQAKIRFLKSKQVIDEREVNRNNDYYAPIFKLFDAKGRPSVPYETVSGKIQRGYDSADLFLKQMPAIYTAFTKSVNFYDKAVKIFAAINSRYNSPEELLLMHDSILEGQLTDIKSNYDSCIFFIDRFINLVNEYPLPNHRPTYKVMRIETFRLDGLITRLNFLTNQIELWNYGDWVNEIRKTLSNEITSLRKEILRSNDQIDALAIQIANAPPDQLPGAYQPDKQLVFNLNHYDRQSVILALLQYKSFRLHWDIQDKSKTLDTLASTRNAEIFSQLIYTNRTADSLLRVLVSRTTPEKVAKHSDFVSKALGGSDNLKKYHESESQRILQTFNHYTSSLKSNLNHSVATDSLVAKGNTIRIGRYTVPLVKQLATPEGLDLGILFTQFNKKNPDGSTYLAGIYKPDKKKKLVNTFVARINPDGKAAWLKDFSIPVDSAATDDAHTYLGPLVLTQEGCSFVTRSIHATTGDIASTFIYIDEKGEDKIRMRLNDNSFARYIQYSEKSNSFTLVLKGSVEQQNLAVEERAVILNINVLGQVAWQKEFAFLGNIVDLVSLVDGYMVVGNYLFLRDLTGKEYRTRMGAGECSPFVLKLNDLGEVVQIKPFVTPASVYIARVVKINDNSINLLGMKEKWDIAINKPLTNADQVVHIMTNKQTQEVCSSY